MPRSWSFPYMLLLPASTQPGHQGPRAMVSEDCQRVRTTTKSLGYCLSLWYWKCLYDTLLPWFLKSRPRDEIMGAGGFFEGEPETPSWGRGEVRGEGRKAKSVRGGRGRDANKGITAPGTCAHTHQETLWRIRPPSAEQKAATLIPSLPGAFISSPSAPGWAGSQGVRTTQRTGPECVSGESQHTWPPSTLNAGEMY